MNRSSPIRSAPGTPILRISRPIAACSRCRRAKIKCDGKLPACSACVKSGHAISCANPIDNSMNGNEKSYVACLESRVVELEEKLALAEAQKSSTALRDTTRLVKTSNHHDSSSAVCKVLNGRAARRREVADVNELVSDFGFLSVNATTQDFEKATTSMTFARLILAAGINEPLPNDEPFRLPSKSVTSGLITYYVDNILPFAPFFSETMLLDVLDAVYQENAQPVTDFGYWIFCIVSAISSTSQSRNKADKYYRDGLIWVVRALSLSDRVLVPGYVSQIQALVLLVQYSILDPAHFDSWNLIGFACRAVVDLGFHQDPPIEEQTDQKTLELRRTIFYCVYSLDRSISMVHARSFSFTDDSTNVALPSLQSETPFVGSQLNTSMRKSSQQALLLFKFRMIQSSWYQELFQSNKSPLTNYSNYIWQMCQEMQKWAQSIPDTLPSSVKDLLDLELFYSYVYCLAPSRRVKAVSACGKSLIFEASINYVQKMTAICQAHPSRTFYTYHDVLRVYFVGSQFVSILKDENHHLLNADASLSPSLEEFSSSLMISRDHRVNNLERSWRCIDQIKSILQDFCLRWEDTRVLLTSFESQVVHLTVSLI